MKKLLATLALSAALLATGGCVSTTTKLVKKSDMEVSTQMSATVFLDPVSSDKRTVFLQLRNTSDKELNIEQGITNALVNKGYKVVQDPDNAHYWIQANVLKVGKADLDEAKHYLQRGYEGAAVGAVIGQTFGGGDGRFATGAIGALAGAAADAFFEDVLYTMVTDLQISERTKDGIKVNELNKQALAQGTSGHKTQTSNEVVDRKKYQTRVVSTANKVNLEFAEAQPVLENGLVKSIKGIL